MRGVEVAKKSPGGTSAAPSASVSGALPALRHAVADLAARLRAGALAPLFVGWPAR
ncbi:hypothetical protein AB3662_07290 [Sorangium cellulosum]|uniref:hypothetical protein n=1 Tax=Sorangium cellulosum TaxID=56 RepID=UPI003D9A6DB0